MKTQNEHTAKYGRHAGSRQADYDLDAIHNKAQNSPLPWRLNQSGWCNEAEVFENQPLIVRAVNHADKLAEALRETLSLLDDLGLTTSTTRDKAQAALDAWEADQ